MNNNQKHGKINFVFFKKLYLQIRKKQINYNFFFLITDQN